MLLTANYFETFSKPNYPISETFALNCYIFVELTKRCFHYNEELRTFLLNQLN